MYCVGLLELGLLQFAQNASFNIFFSSVYRPIGKSPEQSTVTGNAWLTTVFCFERLYSRPKGSDTLEIFLSKVAFESDFRKKTCTCVTKTFAIFLLSKETFTIRTCSILESFFRKLLSKATFERKLSGVSLP